MSPLAPPAPSEVRPAADMRLVLKRLPEAVKVEISPSALAVLLADGRRLEVPLAWFPWLLAASPAERSECELVGNGIGIHWPVLQEDLFVLDLLVGENPPR